MCQPSPFEWRLVIFPIEVCYNCHITSSLHLHERLNGSKCYLKQFRAIRFLWLLMTTPLCLLLPQGGCLRKHSSHHFGDEQWSDAIRRRQQRQWLTELCHVLWQLRSAVPQAHGFAGRVQPPLVGPQRHAQSCQLQAKEALVQAEAQNPQLDGC